jgi:hypothetical protein
MTTTEIAAESSRGANRTGVYLAALQLVIAASRAQRSMIMGRV